VTTQSAAAAPDARRQARPSPSTIVWAALWIVGSTAALVALYYALPLTRSSTWAAVTILVIGLMLFIGLAALQVRAIIRSPFPGLRAVEALATT
jgi:voltage-gated potassium channel